MNSEFVAASHRRGASSVFSCFSDDVFVSDVFLPSSLLNVTLVTKHARHEHKLTSDITFRTKTAAEVGFVVSPLANQLGLSASAEGSGVPPEGNEEMSASSVGFQWRDISLL